MLQAETGNPLTQLPRKLAPVQLHKLKDGLLRSLEKISGSRITLPQLQPLVVQPGSSSLQQPAVSAFVEDDSPRAPTLPRQGPCCTKA